MSFFEELDNLCRRHQSVTLILPNGMQAKNGSVEIVIYIAAKQMAQYLEQTEGSLLIPAPQ